LSTFCCTNRLSRKAGGHCPTRHYPVAAVEEHYRTVHLTKKVRESVWADVHRDADERSAIVQKDIERHQRWIKKLEANQARVVQLSYQGLVSDDVLASEQHRLSHASSSARTVRCSARPSRRYMPPWRPWEAKAGHASATEGPQGGQQGG
jgi:hypothetical protein